MFTGIIEEIGTIQRIQKVDRGAVITVNASTVISDVKIGDSISINGACQTVISYDNNFFTVEAAQETLNLTNLGSVKQGDKVNLERAMAINGRFGGHFVSGHVEGIGELIKKDNNGLAQTFHFKAPDNVLKYIVYKGSVCINGVSLTIASLENDIFTISVIPQTIKETNLALLKIGNIVNLESDIIAKYIEKFFTKNDNINNNNSETLTMNYLEENGFI